MRAPLSPLARRILADPRAAAELVEASRRPGAPEVRVNGETFLVRDAPGYTPGNEERPRSRLR